VDHHNNDVFLVALVQPHSSTSEAAAQQWLHSTHTTIQTRLSIKSLSSQRGAVGFGSSSSLAGSSLAGSSQTHQHMDTASSDAVMSDDDWSHRDQRGSFGSLDSLLTDHSTHSAVEAKLHHLESADKDVLRSETAQPPQDLSHPQQADISSTHKQCTDAIPPFRLARSEQQYLRDVAACQQALHDGDSYEICLTTALLRTHPIDALNLYKTLRKVNPAPYAAWMSFGMDDLQICCSSPERFLKGGRGGLLEARPIKGTAPRSADPEQDRAAALALANSEKDQAENLMIVDLLRNDLGRVCQVCQLPHYSCRALLLLAAC
jgi:anthranilate/para-aminobenzoate synthase component I